MGIKTTGPGRRVCANAACPFEHAGELDNYGCCSELCADKYAHKTAQDARNQVLRAWMGSLAHKPSVEYLRALRDEVRMWREEIDEALMSQEEQAEEDKSAR